MMREGGGTRDGGRWPALSGGPEARGPAQEAPRPGAPGGLWKSRPGGEGSAFADQAWKAQDPGPSSHPLTMPEQGGSLRGRGCCVAARPFSASVFLFQVGGLAGPGSLRSMKLLCLVAVVASLLVLPAQANKVQLPCATTLPAPRHPGGGCCSSPAPHSPSGRAGACSLGPRLQASRRGGVCGARVSIWHAGGGIPVRVLCLGKLSKFSVPSCSALGCLLP